MIRIIIEGFALGLSAGVYCAGACLVFFMPYLVVEGRPGYSENLKKILSFMSGRLAGYIFFALAAGLIGTTYRNIFSAKFSSACLVIASALMLAYAFSHNFSGSGICARLAGRFSMLRMPFFLGLFSGLNPCMPFLVGLTRIWTLDSVFAGVVLFIAFFFGTSVYMVPLLFVSCINRSDRIRRIGVIVALMSGVWFLFVGISGLWK